MDLEAPQSSSPSEVFRDLLDRTVADLKHATYVEEWLGPKQRLPVFDVQVLRDYGADPANRERLSALLASYVRVTSGSFWERSGNRWRRRRFSELNLLDLAERGALGRLGDLTLFLSGVFPEYVCSHPLEAGQLSRLARIMDRSPGELARSGEPFWVMEWVGKSAYGRAGDTALAGHFRSARRLLNVLTGRHLFPIREVWFPGATGS